MLHYEIAQIMLKSGIYQVFKLCRLHFMIISSAEETTKFNYYLIAI